MFLIGSDCYEMISAKYNNSTSNSTTGREGAVLQEVVGYVLQNLQ